MLPYWFLFFLAVGGLLIFGKKTGSAEKAAWWIVCVSFALMIGLRHEVGADWATYLWHFRRIARGTFQQAVEFSDPGYYSLSWLLAEVGGDLYALNLCCGVILMAGVGIFCRAQPLPWLGLTVAVPYLITVVAMGYTRQSAALGFALIGLTYLGRQKNVGFIVAVMIGATFHKSAVLLLPIAALASSRSRLWTWLWVGVTSAVGAQLLIMDESEHLWDAYVEKQKQSDGGMIRVAMNAVPALLFLAFRRKLTTLEGERRLWWWLSIGAVACMPLVTFASTAVDRVALYFIPLQVFVFSRLHRSVAPGSRPVVVASAVAYYAVVLFVWLNFASHAKYWVPYHFMPF